MLMSDATLPAHGALMKLSRLFCLTSALLVLPFIAGAQGRTTGEIRVSATVLSMTETRVAGNGDISASGDEILVTIPVRVRNNVEGAPMSATLMGDTNGADSRSVPVTCGGRTGTCGLPMLFNVVYPVTVHLTGLTAAQRAAYLADPSLLAGRIQVTSVRSGIY
jgi:hypothetical protein